jgi:hypothetical protein
VVDLLVHHDADALGDGALPIRVAGSGGLPQTLWMTVNPATPFPFTLEPESPENV